mgnify:CR=1 FL=1
MSQIIGAGGGGKSGGGSHSPSTAKDNLDSRAYARIIDLISEGEIEGFPSARDYIRNTDDYNKALLKDIYLDKTPILQAKATIGSLTKTDYNFQKVDDNDLKVRWGTQNQTYIEGFSAVEREIGVGVEVKHSTPVTRQINDTNVDRVRVTLTWQALQKIKDNGDIVGRKVEYNIYIAYSGGSFQQVGDTYSVKGRTADPYQKSHNITISGPFPVQIRVERVTKDSSSVKTQSSFTWTSYTEIVDAKLTYPNSALIAWEIDAKEFSSIPTRSYRIRGIKVSIPSNATVNPDNGALIYSGTWDGTFQAATWCADPAWCLWDLLTNCRYGLGQHIRSTNLDKWSFYAASQYCNGLVPSGLYDNNNSPILEPRFLCNISIQNQDEAYKLINDMCSVFRAMPYWSAGSLTIAQDRPADAIYVFNQTNVSEEGFQYSGSSLKTRHSVAVVGYLDTSLQENAYESVEDAAAIARYGVVTSEVTAFACTSRSQARRVGEWLLYTEQHETEVVSFTTGIDAGISARPGQIIAISDPLRSGARRGGRIKKGGSTYILIDEPDATDLPLTGNPTIHVTLEDGSVNVRSVTGVSGNRITVDTAFSATPLTGGVFIYNNDDMSKSLWRVLNVQEQNGTEYVISAVAYNASKYDHIERDVPLNTKTYLPLTLSKPSDPSNVTATTTTTSTNGQITNKLYLSWQGDPTALQYEIRYRLVS